MNSRGLGLGIFLLCIGIILILINTGIIDWSIFDSLADLWPLILVVIGINIIFRNRDAVRIVTWLLFLAVLFAYGYMNGDKYSPNAPKKEGNFYIEKSVETVRGDLKLSLGALNFDLGKADQNLVEGSATNPGIKYSVNYNDGKKTAAIELKQAQTRVFVRGFNKGDNRRCTVGLNGDVLWDINAKLGAVNGTMDLSNLKIENLEADIGAGKLNILLGSSHEMVNVKMNAGASKLELVVPEASGVKLKVNGVLSNTDLGSLNWGMKDGYYISPNYNEADSRINVDLTMGVGSLSVRVQK